MLPFLFLPLLCPSVAGDDNVAFVSTLSSESYTLAAKVLAFSLRQLHPHIPFVLLATQDISNATLEDLRGHNVDVRRTEKMDTPYIADHGAAKYQYTKIRLWSLVSYSSLVHLDLDVLPLRPLHALFHCGDFCAALRHSDLFNSGVFVLRPNLAVYDDMVAKASLHNYSSYDGGDQGFLNTYFDRMKLGPMLAENETGPPACSASTLRPLSAAFNYDIAMYYINNGRELISPALIHYTMGPVKPWKWWTFPLFDLNYKWLSARQQMEATYHEPSSGAHLAWIFTVATGFLIIIYNLLHRRLGDRLRVPSCLWWEEVLAPVSSLLLPLFASLHVVPPSTPPLTAWILFYSSFLLCTVWTGSLYSSLRRGRPFSFSTCTRFVVYWVGAQSLLPVLLLTGISFYLRVLIVVVYGPLSQFLSLFLIWKMLIGDDGPSAKYHLLSNKI